jgi:hypothetical protein
MQSLFIGLGAVLASAAPWMLTNWLGVTARAPGTIPNAVKLLVLHRLRGVLRRGDVHHSHDERKTAG